MACLARKAAPDTYLYRARLDEVPAILAFQRAAIAAVPETYYDAREKAAWLRNPTVGLDALIVNGNFLVVAWHERLMAGAICRSRLGRTRFRFALRPPRRG